MLFAQGLSEGEQPGKAGCSLLATKSSRDFILEFYRLDGPLRTVVIWGHIWVAHEGKDPVLVLDEPFLEPAFLKLGQRHGKQLL